MLKKIIVFLACALIVTGLFFICLMFSFFLEKKVIHAILIWFLLLAGLVLFRFLWGFAAQFKGSLIHRKISSKCKLSQVEILFYERWKYGRRILNRISKRKNDIPWFIVVGGKSGKSTLLSSIADPMISNELPCKIKPTKSLRWWFFRQSAYLEIPHGVLHPKSRVRKVWGKFSLWIKKAKKPSGVILFVSAQDLAKCDKSALYNEGRVIRELLEPLYRSTGICLPVYVVINECDHIPGFHSWASCLPEGAQNRPLGGCWQHALMIDAKDPDYINPFFEALTEGVQCSQLRTLAGRMPEKSTLLMLGLKRKILHLREGLHAYLSSLSQPDSYAMHCSLHGIWLSATEFKDDNHDAYRTFFSKELFSSELPQLVKKIDKKHYGIFRQLLSHRVLPSLCFVFSLIISLNFIHSLFLLNKISKLTIDNGLVSYLEHDASSLSRVKYGVFLPLIKIKNEQLISNVKSKVIFSETPLSNVIADYNEAFLNADLPLRREMILSLSQAILMLKEASFNESLSNGSYQKFPVSLFISRAESSLDRKQAYLLEMSLLQAKDISAHINVLRRLLLTLLNSDDTFSWLFVPEGSLYDVRASDFGYPSVVSSSTVNSRDKANFLSGIFTHQGEKLLLEWGQRISQSLDEDDQNAFINRFSVHIASKRQDAWLVFLKGIPVNVTHPLGESAWHHFMSETHKRGSPSLRLFQFVEQDLASIHENMTQPWLAELRRVNLLRKVATNTASLFDNLHLIDNKLLTRLGLLMNMGDKQQNISSADHQALSLYKSWDSDLLKIFSEVSNTYSRKGASFLGDSSEEKSNDRLISDLFMSFQSFRNRFEVSQNEFSADTVWNILNVENNLAALSLINNQSCNLQKLWDKEVIWPLNNLDKRADHNKKVVKTAELIRAFVRKNTIDFMEFSNIGLDAKRINSINFPFEPNFLHLVKSIITPDDLVDYPEKQDAQGSDELAEIAEEITVLSENIAELTASTFPVNITSLPATLPRPMRLMPTGTRLELFCNDDKQKLENNNFSQQKAFTWSPQSCDKLTLTINFPGFETTINYTGESAFPDFVRDFSSGVKKIPAMNFENGEMLSEIGIDEVIVRYSISNSRAILQNWRDLKILKSSYADAVSKQKEKIREAENIKKSRVSDIQLNEIPVTISYCQ